MMKLVTWNVNGLRACMNKGFMDYFLEAEADFFCLQETKMQPDQASWDWGAYKAYWHSAEKKGYSGTAILCRTEPLSVRFGLPDEAGHPQEGRLITVETEGFFLVCCYTPNAQPGLARIGYRLQWEKDVKAYLRALDTEKPVIYCGDLNVAHQPIDLKHPSSNKGNPGFSDEERGEMTDLLSRGFTDVFRALYPGRKDAYTWWSYLGNARKNNTGWRIDYFIASERFLPQVEDCILRSDVYGSDHCPVELLLKS